MTARSDAARRLDTLASRGIRPGLGTMRAVLEALGNPHLAVPTVLVAGTNGKGSTVAMLSAIAQAGGYRCGRFTSPMLARLEDQLAIAGTSIDETRLAACLETVISTAERRAPGHLTPFEAMAAAAFVWLADEGVDLAVVEVGMGGTDDACNVAEPMLSMITTIGDDHRRFLGPTRADIARSKAGVLRSGRPGVVGWLDARDAAVVRDHAVRVGARPRFAAEAVTSMRRTTSGLEGQEVDLETDRQCYRLSVPLAGEHQATNAVLAVLAAEILSEAGFPRLDRDVIERGIRSCQWPGRIERCVGPSGRPILLDAAHNADGARALAHTLGEVGVAYDLLFGTFEDKPAGQMLSLLTAGARRVHLVAVDHPRSWDPLAWSAAQSDVSRFPVVADLGAGLALDGRVPLLVCGSLHLIGVARARLGAPTGVTP